MTATGFPAAATPDKVHFAKNASLAVAIGDLLYLVTDDVRPVSGQADGGSEAANQASAAPLFAGVAGQAALAADGAVTEFVVHTDVIVDIDCSSATFEVGDKVTFVEDSGGTYLENQKVAKTTDETLAIGYVVKRYGSAVTRVRCRLISRIAGNAAAPDVTAVLSSATLPVIIFNGATGANEIRVPTNLADALSIEDSAGDLIVIDTTTGTQVITVTPATTFSTSVTSPVVVFNGATGANEIRVPTNLADALSVESSAGDILTIDTTTGTVVLAFGAAVRVNVAGDFQGGSATTDLVAFHGSTPTDQCAAYTQTYSTADRTHANPTADALTDSTGGSAANQTLAAVGNTMGGDVSSDINNNFAKCAEEINALIIDLADLKQLANSIIDDLQEKGLVG